MARTKPVTASKSSQKGRPPLTPEARENQMIALAVDLAEQQLRDGTASSQLITHYLKLATQRERLERERLEEENKLLRAKTEAIQRQEASDEMYKKALKAFGIYSGQTTDDEEDEYDYYD